jgi:hypothetical protein
MTRSRSRINNLPPSDFVSPRAATSRRVRRSLPASSMPAAAATDAPRVRRSASSSMSRPAALIRPWAFVDRAFAPRRSHAISRRTVLASDSW